MIAGQSIYFYSESLCGKSVRDRSMPFRTEPIDGMSEIVGGKPAGLSMSHWRRWLAISLAAGLAWGGWVWWTDRNYFDDHAVIELGDGERSVRDRRPKLDEAPGIAGPICDDAILPARCEQGKGRSEPAAKALARVEPGSVFSHKAILGRMRLAHDKGQLAAAEQIVNAAAADPRTLILSTRFLLVPIYSQLGRLDETERLIEERWEHLNETGEGASETAIDLVRMHIQLAFKPNPSKDARAYLELAAGLAPGDDRVWLGRANLAIRTGAYDEAERWLDACLERRPEDVPVWRARLSWGMATDQLEVARQALKHLPAEDWTSAQVHRLESLARRQAAIERQNWSTSWRKIPRIGRPSTGSPDWRRKRRNQPRSPNFCARKRKSIGSGLATRNCTIGTSPFATRRRWPTWPSSSAACSRPESSSPWRSRKSPNAMTCGRTCNG